MIKIAPAPASPVQEIEALIVRGERLGHAPSSRPEIYVGRRSWAQPARGGRSARITVDARLLDCSASDRCWVIGHELGHLLPGSGKTWTLWQRTLMGVGVAIVAGTVIALGAVAVPAGWASIPDGPAWGWGLIGLMCGLVIAVAGLMQHSRDTETACDRASAVVYGQTMTEEHVADLLRWEGLTARLTPTALRSHPRPRRRALLLLPDVQQGAASRPRS